MRYNANSATLSGWSFIQVSTKSLPAPAVTVRTASVALAALPECFEPLGAIPIAGRCARGPRSERRRRLDRASAETAAIRLGVGTDSPKSLRHDPHAYSKPQPGAGQDLDTINM